ncbi:hypothetical protein TNCV_2378701 [Trichonephila clavipes]|uniref:Uncharacterized protein n=1 Tax=Trichonephila clavipes TaxID=2585209 RepID=A0A8X6RTF0_TRICX|nr:hypothetical protein TNCV_2378701 [Trichonephila clavipes]
MSNKSIMSLQPESSGPESSMSHEEGSNSKDDKFFEEKQNELMARMLKRPILKPFVGLPPPKIKEPASTKLVWKKNAEPMLGFSEFRKYKRVNETRTITPYDPKEFQEKPNGYVNKQNCRIWSEANPQVYVETPLHPEKLTVWCALWAGGILLHKR